MYLYQVFRKSKAPPPNRCTSFKNTHPQTQTNASKQRDSCFNLVHFEKVVFSLHYPFCSILLKHRRPFLMKRHEQPGGRIMEKKFQRMWRWKEHEKPPLPPILIHIFLWGDLTSPQRLQSMLDLPNTPNLLDGYFYGGAMKMWGTDTVVIDTAPQDNKSIMKGKILVMTGDTENARKLKLFEQYLGDHFRRHEKYLYFADGSTLGFGSVFVWVGNRDQLQKWVHSDCRIPTLEENTLKSFPGDSDTALEDRAGYPILPQDIIDMIINFLSRDRITLCSCALVSSAWLNPSRRHIFYSIRVSNSYLKKK
ncbi:hypothetical protein ABKN59_006487 [Abortiporus biennis]